MQRSKSCQLGVHTWQCERLSSPSRKAQYFGGARHRPWFVVSLVVSLFVLAALWTSPLIVGHEPTTPAIRESQMFWKIAIQKVDDALTAGDINAAVRAWDDAYPAVLGAGTWEALVGVGDAYRRIGEVARKPESFDAKAREIYLLALSQARRQGCVECLLRIAEAFAALGDREHVELSVRLADLLAAQDPETEADVRAFTMRFTDQLLHRASGREEWRHAP